MLWRMIQQMDRYARPGRLRFLSGRLLPLDGAQICVFLFPDVEQFLAECEVNSFQT